MRPRKVAAALTGLLFLIPAAAFAAADEPVWPTKGWAVSTPEEQGMDSSGLAQLVDRVGTYQQDSLLIARHGRIVAEAYYAPYVAGIPHDLRSVTKSVVSTLTAIEIQHGLLDSTEHRIIDYFADRPIANLDDDKRAMTVQSLLDMTSGIAWVEKAYTPDETIMRMYDSPNRTAFVLDQPMAGAPGAKFYYNSGNPYVLSALLTKLTGRSAAAFATAELFAPLGIASAYWRPVDAQGISDGESGLYLTPRDMAKIGYLYLRDGVWEGKRMIPAAWVERAQAGPVSATFGFHYGNLWWSLPEKGGYMALGRHSQTILVLPKQDVIAVMTGFLPDDEFYPKGKLIDAIAGAIKSDQPLPPDTVARSVLAASIGQAATERPSPVGEMSALATAISGKLYRFGENKLHVTTLALDLIGPTPSWEITTTDSPERRGERFAGPIGLDGVSRNSPRNSYGITAVKGRWLGERSFALDQRILGQGGTLSWIITFEGKTVGVHFSSTDGMTADLHGETTD